VSAGTITATGANNIVEQQLHHHLTELENALHADALAFYGPIYYQVESYIRDAIEAQGPQKKGRLVVVLETEGGSIEVTQRIADTLRHHYPNEVDFIIPDHAMSAGTVLALSGDSIYMDYFSVLGPIDPQVQNKDGRWVPALGYVHKYNDLIKKAKDKKLTAAEVTFLVSRFDPGELYAFEQARNLSEQLLIQWLVKYKFKNWNKTETRKHKVTSAIKEARAKEVARKLNDSSTWNSHARPLTMEVLRKHINLKIDDFGSNPELNRIIKCYYRLLRDYITKRGATWVIHTTKEYKAIGGQHG
jgi:membrane-bound ClpP family serine protease